MATHDLGFLHGINLEIQSFSGAHAVRVIGGADTISGEHAHDWPVLSLYVMGDYRKASDGKEIRICGPSAVLHGAGEAHANRLSEIGLEQIDLQFDPRWLRGEIADYRLQRVQCWVGGEVAAAAARLASFWSSPNSSEQELAAATSQFLRFAFDARDERSPTWLSNVLERLQIACPPTASQLAEQVGLHPSWLAQAYRAAMGEGLRQTLQRRRVEYATTLLRGTDLPPADIAAAAGFCDQSHMNRGFRHLLGRTPMRVRAEASLLRAAMPLDRRVVGRS